MNEKHGTGIEWTHRPGTKGVTWNPIRAVNKETGGRGHFCVHVTEGCRNCYAERLQPRFKNPIRYAAQDYEKVRLEMPENLLMQPHKWRAPRTIFPFSMTDLFLEHHPLKWIDAVFDVMARATRHTFIVLTKRGRVMHYYMNDRYRHRPPPANVWLVVSIHDQPSAEAAVPLLRETPAAVRCVSAEPLLGPVDFTKMKNEFGVYFDALQGYAMITDGRGNQEHIPLHGPVLDWIIAGGESGPARDPQKPIRPMHPDWVRAIESQCRHAGTPFFFKQWGDWAPVANGWFVPDHEAVSVMPDGAVCEWQPDYPAARLTSPEMATMVRVGKKAAGNLLDGRNPTTAHGAAVNAAAALAMQLGSPRGSPTRFNQQWQKPAPRGLGLGTLVQIPLDDCQPFGMGQKGTWAYVLIKNRAEDPAARAREFLERRPPPVSAAAE